MSPSSPAAPASADGASLWQPWYTVSLVVILLAVLPAGLLLPPLWAWIVTMALLLLFIAITGRGMTGLWWGALVDERNMMSLSRTQMTLWTVLILPAILAAAMANLDAAGPERALDFDIPSQLWLLMGIATTSLVAAPLVRSTKTTREPDPDQRSRGLARAAARQRVAADAMDTSGLVLVNKEPECARWSNVVHGEEAGNGGQLDLGKIQNLYFTLILAAAYAAALGATLSAGGVVRALPGLDSGMVTLLAISHAGYLTLKAVPHSRTGS